MEQYQAQTKEHKEIQNPKSTAEKLTKDQKEAIDAINHFVFNDPKLKAMYERLKDK
ncbi:hypothetical protein [Helicobacter sp. 12S02634-8]|uniref:hypothetical protein n=1 Tax=Helicobacter sp. 12S02634-8 TaxID=1476199 RepID=UPI001553D858|nr:hypothetical protein [Helicobacter sp. 12S02634-8]